MVPSLAGAAEDRGWASAATAPRVKSCLSSVEKSNLCVHERIEPFRRGLEQYPGGPLSVMVRRPITRATWRAKLDHSPVVALLSNTRDRVRRLRRRGPDALLRVARVEVAAGTEPTRFRVGERQSLTQCAFDVVVRRVRRSPPASRGACVDATESTEHASVRAATVEGERRVRLRRRRPHAATLADLQMESRSAVRQRRVPRRVAPQERVSHNPTPRACGA